MCAATAMGSNASGFPSVVAHSQSSVTIGKERKEKQRMTENKDKNARATGERQQGGAWLTLRSSLAVEPNKSAKPKTPLLGDQK